MVIEAYKIGLWLWWESYLLGRLAEVVNSAILFVIRLTRMMGKLFRGATFVVNFDHLLYNE